MLPAPVNKYVEVKKQEVSKPKAKKVYNIPPYGQRENYVPRTLEDFGDGGAFPEILILQYPLDMGRSDRAGDTRVVTVATDEDGVPDFQKNLLNQGSNKQMIVHTKVSSLIGSSAEGFLELRVPLPTDDDLARPSDEAIAALTQKTRESMEKKVNRKIAYALPGKLPEGSLPGDVKPAEFYKYSHPIASIEIHPRGAVNRPRARPARDPHGRSRAGPAGPAQVPPPQGPRGVQRRPGAHSALSPAESDGPGPAGLEDPAVHLD